MAATTQKALCTLHTDQARTVSSIKDCMALYDTWAATYNDEMVDKAHDYVAPTLVGQLAVNASTDLANSVILDAGCGTGLVGQALASSGARTIDGLDLSGPMLKIAKQSGAYRYLFQADMTKRLEQADNTYDTVTCAGTFTAGHVGPKPALRELVRVTKKGGNLVITILEELWVEAGFEAEVKQLAAENIVTVIADEPLDYVKGRGDKAIFAVLKKN